MSSAKVGFVGWLVFVTRPQNTVSDHTNVTPGTSRSTQAALTPPHPLVPLSHTGLHLHKQTPNEALGCICSQRDN